MRGLAFALRVVVRNVKIDHVARVIEIVGQHIVVELQGIGIDAIEGAAMSAPVSQLHGKLLEGGPRWKGLDSARQDKTRGDEADQHHPRRHEGLRYSALPNDRSGRSAGRQFDSE